MQRTKHPEAWMNASARRAVASVAQQLEQARSDVRRSIWRRREAGEDAETARLNVASDLRAPPGTIENLIRRRLRRLDAWLRDNINCLVLRELESEFARLQHELETRRRSGSHLASQQIGEIETHISAVREAMNSLR